jgi:hypothetical protein
MNVSGAHLRGCRICYEGESTVPRVPHAWRISPLTTTLQTPTQIRIRKCAKVPNIQTSLLRWNWGPYGALLVASRVRLCVLVPHCPSVLLYGPYWLVCGITYCWVVMVTSNGTDTVWWFHFILESWLLPLFGTWLWESSIGVSAGKEREGKNVVHVCGRRCEISQATV